MKDLQFLPDVAEERTHTLVQRARVWVSDGTMAAEELMPIVRANPFAWRTSALLLRLVFFALTSVGVAAFYGLMKLFLLPAGLITAALTIAAAELLIVRRHFFRTGIESALWLGGLFAIIVSLPSSGKPEAILVFVAAFAIVGLRLRIAFFGASAAALVVAYIGAKTHAFWPPAWTGLALAGGAALMLTRHWQRPSTDELLAWLVATMPAASYIGGKIAGSSFLGGRPELFEARIVLMYALAGGVSLAMGLRFRHHALFGAAGICAAAALFELCGLVDYPHENELIVSGLLLLGSAFAISRLLRGRASGLVITRTADRLELTRLAATVAITHAHEPATAAAEPQVEGGGGRFGGAGATGDY